MKNLEKYPQTSKGARVLTISSSASPPSVIIWYICLTLSVIVSKPSINSFVRCLIKSLRKSRLKLRASLTSLNSFLRLTKYYTTRVRKHIERVINSYEILWFQGQPRRSDAEDLTLNVSHALTRSL